jgi:hypothetical protein
MKFITSQIRSQLGKFVKSSDEILFHAGIERMGYCTICGTKIENHVPVYNPEIGYMCVGCECFGILTGDIAPQLNRGESYKTNDGKIYINPNNDFITRLESQISEWENQGYIDSPFYKVAIKVLLSVRKGKNIPLDQYNFYLSHLK